MMRKKLTDEQISEQVLLGAQDALAVTVDALFRTNFGLLQSLDAGLLSAYEAAQANQPKDAVERAIQAHLALRGAIDRCKAHHASSRI